MQYLGCQLAQAREVLPFLLRVLEKNGTTDGLDVNLVRKKHVQSGRTAIHATQRERFSTLLGKVP